MYASPGPFPAARMAPSAPGCDSDRLTCIYKQDAKTRPTAIDAGDRTMTKTFTLTPATLGLAEVAAGLARVAIGSAIDPAAFAAIDASAATVQAILDQGKTAYGINTGFGSLAHTRIPDDQVTELQRRLVAFPCRWHRRACSTTTSCASS